MDSTVFHTWWTVVLFITIIGIIAWAWSGKRKETFDAAARMPLDDDDQESPAGRHAEK
jgi:cytochrome c oxidase cbb3-type subunit 4